MNESVTCEEIISTLREMNVLESKNEGYIPTYIRIDLIDQLHETFGFRTDTEIITINKILKNKNSTHFWAIKKWHKPFCILSLCRFHCQRRALDGFEENIFKYYSEEYLPFSAN